MYHGQRRWLVVVGIVGINVTVFGVVTTTVVGHHALALRSEVTTHTIVAVAAPMLSGMAGCASKLLALVVNISRCSMVLMRCSQ